MILMESQVFFLIIFFVNKGCIETSEKIVLFQVYFFSIIESQLSYLSDRGLENMYN